MKKGKHFHCPVNGWDCPYYKDKDIIEGEEEFHLCTIGNPYTFFRSQQEYSYNALSFL